MKKTRKVDKREQHIKKKLTAAILMLLISSIMTVTSTYAWFTLSTAPEVTGIQTTIGGNGNLEIALANAETWGDPTKVQTLTTTSESIVETNASWGNLIDVSPVGTTDNYGINKLTLSPARLNLTGNTVEPGTILSVPKYGADGRISQLTAAMNATYNTTDSSFTMANPSNYGIRAIGISAAMTSRQSNFMNAKSAVSSSVSMTKQTASTGLSTNGGTLGNVAVKYATEADPKFTLDDMNAIMALLTSTENAAKNIDDAVLSMMDAYVASAANQTKYDTEGNVTSTGISDFEYGVIKNILADMNIWDEDTDTVSSSLTLTEIKTGETVTGYSKATFEYELTEEGSATATDKTFDITNADFLSLIFKYVTIRTNISTAINSLQTEINKSTDSYTWSQISPSVNAMMVIEKVKVAGMTMEQLRQKKNDGTLVNALMPYVSNLVIELGPGSGVYYDMAELVGTIKAGMTMDLTYGGMDLNDLNATIIAECTTPTALIPGAVNAFEYPTSAGSAEASRISDIYGYALDLLFRTNADNSSLLLQTTPIDRIYDNNNNVDTMGGGSTMTFTKTASSYSTESMLGLMDAIKIVFVDELGNVLGKAGLDTGTKTKYTAVSDGTATHVEDGGVYYEVKYVADTVAEGAEQTYHVATGEEIAEYYLKDTQYKQATPTHKQEITTNYVENADGTFDVSIRMYNSDESAFIYEDTKSPITTYTYREKTGTETATHIGVTSGQTTNYYEVKYILNADTTDVDDDYREVKDTETATHYHNGTAYVAIDDNNRANYKYVATPTTTYETVNPVITSLSQNTPERVSVIVYLDGDSVGNEDVANAATSMTATLNLQFASDAGLVPMEYSGLHVTGTTPSESPDSNNP